MQVVKKSNDSTYLNTKKEWKAERQTELYAIMKTICARKGRFHHNFDRIHSLRVWAGMLGLPYCPDLDMAIAAQSAIVDKFGNLRERSAQWLLLMNPLAIKSANLIRSTQNHGFSDDNRMIVLDLAYFLDEVSCIDVMRSAIKEYEFLFPGKSKKDYERMYKSYVQNIDLTLDLEINRHNARLNSSHERLILGEISRGIKRFLSWV